LNVPLTSLRGLAALLVMAAALQTEHTAGVAVTTLFQSGVVLLAGSVFVMRSQSRTPVPPPRSRAQTQTRAQALTTTATA
jgi:hypothetical protein